MTARTDIRPEAAAPSEHCGQPLEDADTEAEPPETGASLAVDVVRDDADWSAFGDAEALVQMAAAALASHPGLDISHAGAVVALSSDSEVAILNGQYRNQPKPTNVLSFPPARAPVALTEGAPRALGDIILARETILREAAESGTKPEHHVQHLVIHGLLHLIGYDHNTDAEAGHMEAIETAVLARLGIPDPYAVPAEEADVAPTAKP